MKTSVQRNSTDFPYDYQHVDELVTYLRLPGQNSWHTPQ